MSIATEYTRLKNAKEDIKASIIAKGIAVPDGTKLDGMSVMIDQISGSEPLAEYSQMNPLVAEYMANVTYDPSDYTVSSIDTYAGQETDYRKDQPSGKTLTLKNAGTLRLYCDKSYDITSVVGENTVYNLIPGIVSVWANIIDGEVKQCGSLKPSGSVRMIKCASALNVRDLGGWACDGGKIKYGKLFRGGILAASDRKAIVDQCGVKCELDLRGKSEANNSTESVLGSDVEYTCTDSYVWYSLSNTADWKTILKTTFDAVKYGKPLYFHCAAGADRTGTVACIIETILGVSQSDIDKDYELTSFYTGVSSDAAARRRNEADWTGLINQITALSVGDTFRDKVLNWVASLGFTVDEINDFRAAMIDGTPDTITLSIGTQTVTNTLTNVSNDNKTESVTKYQPYESNITAQKGYVIDSIKVMMGGVDVTASAFSGTRTNLYRAVSTNLINCTIDNAKKTVIDGQGYVATLIVNDGYILGDGAVTITMGGVDVSTYYSGGKIAIPNVTGDLVITATAVSSATSYTNPAEPTSEDWKEGYRINSSGALTAYDGYTVTNYIPCKNGDILRVKGIQLQSGSYPRIKLLKNDKSPCTGPFLMYPAVEYDGSAIALIKNVTNVDSNGVFSWTVGMRGDGKQTECTIYYIRVCGMLTGTADDVIITANESIV